jgi:threonine aldolase
VETNIVVPRVTAGPRAATALIAGLKDRGILISQLAPESVRLVTHRHIGYNEVSSALAAVREVMAGL